MYHFVSSLNLLETDSDSLSQHVLLNKVLTREIYNLEKHKNR